VASKATSDLELKRAVKEDTPLPATSALAIHNMRFSAAAAAVATTVFAFAAAAGAINCASAPLLCGDLTPPPAFDATFVTTAGNFTVRYKRVARVAAADCIVVHVHRLCDIAVAAKREQVHSELSWAPLGSARFYTLCRMGYYSEVKCARSVSALNLCDALQLCGR
jgi:hypothetical protein